MPNRIKLKANSSRPSASSSHESSSISSSSAPEDVVVPNLKPLPQAHAPLACVDPALAIPFDMSILTIAHKRDRNAIKAVIVGGGIAGLAMAIMMDMAGMEFDILERSTGNEPCGGCAVALGPPVLRLLEQMGLLPQVERASKVVTGVTIVDGECRRLGRVEGMDESRYGYPFRVMSREAFHQILLDRVPKSHLYRGKLVVETLQNPNGASCKCSDGSTYYGDIIVGADGAQSLTREKLYTQLKEKGKLPDADMEVSCFEHLCYGGVSDPLDKSTYPSSHDASAEFRVIYTKDAPYTFWYLPVADNRVAWGISSCPGAKYKLHPYSHPYSHINGGSQLSQDLYNVAAATRPFISQLDPPSNHYNKSSNSKPGNSSRAGSSGSSGSSNHRAPSLSRSSSSTSQSKIYDDWFVPCDVDLEDEFQELLDKKCAIGIGSVRDFVAKTPKKAIVKLDMEERMYKTWYHRRIVLIGDACHQNLVIGGQGTIQGLLDAVCLVSLLYDMEYNTPSELTKVFKKYQSKRMGVAKASMEETSQMDKIFHGQGLKAEMMRKFMFNTVWSFNMKNDKFNNNRPQLSFLPFVEDRGTSKANRQKVSGRLTGTKTFAI